MREALLAIRPASAEEEGPDRPGARELDGLPAPYAAGCLRAWLDDVAPQHPHPVWETITEDTPLESINVTSLKSAEEHLYRR
ncbi:MAG: hypothetical protein ACKPKO_56325, partial [Candidatus Fonsibacter sp.]